MQEPAHDTEAEAAVIGAAMLDATCIPELQTIICEGDFYSSKHRLAWRAIDAIARDGGTPDVILVRSWLSSHGELESAGGMRALLSLESSAGVGRAPEYAQRVKACSELRMWAELGHRLQVAQAAGADPAECHAMVEKHLRHQETGAAAWKAWDEIPEPDDGRGFDIGIPQLQKATGGLYEGLNGIAGMPGAGKTTLCCQITNRLMASGHPVSIVSMDQSPHALKNVMRQSWAGCSESSMERVDFSGMPTSCRFYHGRFDLSGILAALRVNAASGYRHALVDYLGLIAVPSASSQWAGMEEAAKSLKRLALELNLVVMLVLSYTKPQKGEGIGMSQVRGSLEVAHAVEQLWIMKPDAEPNKPVRLFLEKARHKARSYVDLDFRGAIRRFYDWGDVAPQSMVEKATPGMAEIDRRRREQ